MSNFSFLIHSHSECVDVLELCLKQLYKYFPDNKKYILLNKEIDIKTIQEQDKNISILYYNESDIYTKRFVNTIDKIDETNLLFIHEDMILYDRPNYEELDRLVMVIDKKNIDFIKLIASTGITDEEIEPRIRKQNEYTFAIQPTIWKKNSLKKLMLSFEETIYGLEISCQDFCREVLKGYTYFSGDEIKRGQAHFDSTIFPYTATAIVRGKWNYLEYNKELTSIFSEYNVSSNRGIFDKLI